jgi:hypothetical protein
VWKNLDRQAIRLPAGKNKKLMNFSSSAAHFITTDKQMIKAIVVFLLGCFEKLINFKVISCDKMCGHTFPVRFRSQHDNTTNTGQTRDKHPTNM